MPLLTGKASDFLKIGVAAAGRGDIATVQVVLDEQPAWLRRVGSHGRTMLWEAAYRGRLGMVEYLADRGADVDACGCHFTPLLVDILGLLRGAPQATPRRGRTARAARRQRRLPHPCVLRGANGCSRGSEPKSSPS